MIFPIILLDLIVGVQPIQDTIKGLILQQLPVSGNPSPFQTQEMWFKSVAQILAFTMAMPLGMSMEDLT